MRQFFLHWLGSTSGSLLSRFAVVFLVIGYTACRSSHHTPRDPGSFNTLADAELRQFAISGELPHLDRAVVAVEDSRRAAPWDHNRAGLTLAIRVDLASHRFAEAKNDAQKLRLLLPGYGRPLLFLGDALFNLGAISEAERLWDEPEAHEEGPLGTEPRLAGVDLVYGRTEAAQVRLENALEKAKAQSSADPLQIAWSATLLGELFFKRGDWQSAERFYQEALTVLPDYYAALDHLAELRGAQGRTEEAIRLYQGLVDRLRRPEFYQALGDLYAYAGRGAEAQPWYHRALDAYLESAGLKGEVLYFHHLSGFYADSLGQPAEAVNWAKKDLEVRQTIQAYDSLAWALSKAGATGDARAAAERALATGTRDPHILYHAGLILIGAGEIAAGEMRLKQAATENPRFNAFHEHR